MRTLVFLSFVWTSLGAFSQLDTAKYLDEITAFQEELNEFYSNKETSPLTKKERKAFSEHRFFKPNLDYIVEAKFERITTIDTVVMGTSAGTKKSYQPYALLHFSINGVECELTAYQSLRLREMEEYKDYLFLPFKDATSGDDTYGGGRYIDLKIPDTDTILLNFNLAYNPYCAYTAGYYCTIPPDNNTLKVSILAGIKAPADHH